MPRRRSVSGTITAGSTSNSNLWMGGFNWQGATLEIPRMSQIRPRRRVKRLLVLNNVDRLVNIQYLERGRSLGVFTTNSPHISIPTGARLVIGIEYPEE